MVKLVTIESKYREELLAERDRIDAILEAMGAPVANRINTNHTPSSAAPVERKKRTLSAAARNKISAAQRARWAAIRKNRKARSTTTAKARVKTRKATTHSAEPKEAKAAA